MRRYPYRRKMKNEYVWTLKTVKDFGRHRIKLAIIQFLVTNQDIICIIGIWMNTLLSVLEHMDTLMESVIRISDFPFNIMLMREGGFPVFSETKLSKNSWLEFINFRVKKIFLQLYRENSWKDLEILWKKFMEDFRGIIGRKTLNNHSWWICFDASGNFWK